VPVYRFLASTIPVALLASTLGASASAAPGELLRSYEADARQSSPGYTASAERGALFFQSRHAGEWTCASCHTAKPVAAGQHAKTGKTIAALAPAANAERFTDIGKVEKWFRRNCNDVLNRACTPQE
jgi:hypothetical protein